MALDIARSENHSSMLALAQEIRPSQKPEWEKISQLILLYGAAIEIYLKLGLIRQAAISIWLIWGNFLYFLCGGYKLRHATAF